MNIELSQLFVWVVLGGLGGAIAGMIVRRTRRGFGLFPNIAIGMIGALIGGVIFDFIDIPALEQIQFTLEDLVASVVGSLILVGVVALIRRRL